MNKDLHKRLEEAAEKFAFEKFKRSHISETYSIYPTFFKIYKEEYLEMAGDVWKEAIKVAKEWLEDNAHDYSFSNEGCDALLSDFETDMNKLWEEKI